MIKKYKRVITSGFIALFFLSFATAASKSAKIVYPSLEEATSDPSIKEISIGKTVKSDFNSKKCIIIHDEKLDKDIPVVLYKVKFEEEKTYSIVFKSNPNGVVGLNPDKKSVVIPEIFLFDENKNQIKNVNYVGEAKAPTNLEAVLYKVTTDWEIQTSGTYYLGVKPDLSEDVGFEFDYGGGNVLPFRTTIEGKFSFVVQNGPSKNTGAAIPKPANPKLKKAVAEIQKAQPAKGDTWYMDIEDEVESKYSASAFYASSIFLMLDERLNLSSVMNDEQKVQFTRALVKDLPALEKDTDVRAIVVGDRFAEQGELRNLIILISKVQLKKGVIPGVDFGYLFQTNAMLTTNKTTGETNAISTGFMINSSIDYNFIAVPFENGMLVTSGNLNLGKESYNAEMSLIDKGNLIDTFVKDEVIENDAEIEAIYKEIISSKENEPVTKLVLAPLNYGLYLAKEGKVAEAEKLWKGIDVSKLPSETDKDKNSIESLKTIFDRDIPDLLTILKNY